MRDSCVKVLQGAVWRHAAQRVGQLCRGSARCRVEACCVDSVKP